MGNLFSGRSISKFGVVLALLISAAFLIACQDSSSTNADDIEPKGFPGFWMAVDHTDGGFNKLSLVDKGNNEVDLNLSETHVTSCSGGRAILSGLGTVDGGVLTVPITIQCLNEEVGENYNKPLGDPIGPLPVKFELLNDNLIEFYFAPIELRVPYHRVSSN